MSEKILRELEKNYKTSKGDVGSLPTTFDNVFFSFKELVSGAARVTYKINNLRGTGFSVEKRALSISRLSEIVKFIKPKKFNVSFFSKYIDDKFIRPYLKTDFTNEQWKTINYRAKTETKIGGQMKLAQSLFTVMCAITMTYGFNAVVDNPYLGYLRHYLDFLKVEPFREGVGGAIYDIAVDSCAATRCYMCVRCAMVYADGKYNKDVLNEMFLFLFKSPFEHQYVIKNNITMHKQAFFDLAPKGKGEVIDWGFFSFNTLQPVPEEISVKTVEDNDIFHFRLHQDKFKEEQVELKKHKLFYLAGELDRLIHASPNHKNMMDAAIYFNPHYLCGFMRTHRAKSHKAQTAFKPKYDVNKLTMGRHIEDQWEDLMLNYYKSQDHHVNEQQYYRTVPTLLTSKSAGLESIRVDLYLDKPIPGAVRQPNGKYKAAFTFTDKTAHFFHDPQRFLHKDNFEPNNKDSPWRIGTRDVPGKASRAIFLVVMHQYVIEGAFIPYFFDQVMVRDKRPNAPLLDSSNNFTMGKETGRHINDHYDGIANSSKRETYAIETDFSAFDSTEEYDNTRVFQIRGLEKGFIKSGANKDNPFFGFPNSWEAFKSVLESRKKLFFKSAGSDDVLELNQLFSGEFQTILFNNITNRAFARTVVDELMKNGVDIRAASKIVKWVFMGDDAICFIKVTEKQWTFDLYKKLCAVFVDVATVNGLDLNFQKTVIRKYFYEYLKKIALYGYILPLYLQTDCLSAEQPAYDQDPMRVTMGMWSTLSTMASRGWSPDFLRNFGTAFWNMKRAVKKHSQKHDKTTEWFLLPFAGLYTPIGAKGCGLLPWSLLFPAKDGVIALYASKNPVLADQINQAHTVLDIRTSNVAKNIANALLKKENTYPKGFFSKGRKFITRFVRIPEKRKNAIESEKELLKAGVKLPVQRYTRFTQYVLQEAVMNNPRLLNIKSQVKTLYGDAYEGNANKPTIDYFKLNFGWIHHMHITKKDKLRPRLKICPFVMDPKLRRLYRSLGYVRSASVYSFSVDQIFRMIKKDKNFPRYLRAETVFDIISKPNIIFFQERIFHMLVVLGLDKKIAATLTASLLSSNETYRMLTESKIVSTNDNIVGQMNLSTDTFNKICSIPNTGNATLNSVLNVLLMAYAIIESDRLDEEVHRYNLMFSNEGLKKMMIQFTGRQKTYKALSNLDVFNLVE